MSSAAQALLRPASSHNALHRLTGQGDTNYAYNDDDILITADTTPYT